MLLTCPRCGTGLSAEEEESGLTWRCAGCGGISINYSQFRRRVSAWHANRIWDGAAAAKLASPRTACPECRRPMVAAAMPKDASGSLRVGLCVPCQRLWMETVVPAVEEGSGRLRIVDSRDRRVLE